MSAAPPASVGRIYAADSGLAGVVANESAISSVLGEEGRLIYRGYDIHDLAEHSSCEETAYLLLYGELPTKSRLKEFTAAIKASQKLDRLIQRLLREAPKAANPMDVLRTAASAAALADPDRSDLSPAAELRKAIRLIAQLPTMVAHIHRLRTDQKPLSPRRGLSLAANLFYMITGNVPDRDAERAFDVAMILQADHELSPSTFAARAIAATLADVHGAVTGAIAALAGPLDGGANTDVMKMLLEIREPERAEAWISAALAARHKVAGFGHRLYPTEDPRAAHFRRLAEEQGKKAGQPHWSAMQRIIEDVMRRERGLFCNVDFYSASLFYVMGIPLDLYTPLLAASRVSGWCAHVLEQHADNRLIRLRAQYVGPINRRWVPPRKRG